MWIIIKKHVIVPIVLRWDSVHWQGSYSVSGCQLDGDDSFTVKGILGFQEKFLESILALSALRIHGHVDGKNVHRHGRAAPALAALRAGF
jgi:hypothetical protein